MRAARSAFVGGGTPAPTGVRSSLTDFVLQAVAAELERQRPGIDGLKGVRTVAIRVRVPAITAVPRLDTRGVVVNLETER